MQCPDFWSQVLGNFLGIIAGVIITYIVQWRFEINGQKRLLKNFISEVKLNIGKLQGWIKELENYRNAVNGDNIQNYFGFFKFSSFLGTTANQLHISGVAYESLTEQEFSTVQEIYNFYAAYEQPVNNKIIDVKTLYNNNKDKWISDIKPEAVNHINFLNDKLTEHKNSLQKIVDSLSQRKL